MDSLSPVFTSEAASDGGGLDLPSVCFSVRIVSRVTWGMNLFGLYFRRLIQHALFIFSIFQIICNSGLNFFSKNTDVPEIHQSHLSNASH